MGPSFKVGYAFTMVYRRAADDAVHVITFVQQEFCQIRSALSCNARDEGNVLFAHNSNVLLVCYSVVSDDWPRRVSGFGCWVGVVGCGVGVALLRGWGALLLGWGALLLGWAASCRVGWPPVEL